MNARLNICANKKCGIGFLSPSGHDQYCCLSCAHPALATGCWATCPKCRERYWQKFTDKQSGAVKRFCNDCSPVKVARPCVLCGKPTDSKQLAVCSAPECQYHLERHGTHCVRKWKESQNGQAA